MKWYFLLIFCLPLFAFGTIKYNPPKYDGYLFLANTAQEMTYTKDPTASPPPKTNEAFINRANGTCRALGHNRGRFAVPKTLTITKTERRKKLVIVDVLGFMRIQEFGYLPNFEGKAIYPTVFEKLECF